MTKPGRASITRLSLFTCLLAVGCAGVAEPHEASDSDAEIGGAAGILEQILSEASVPQSELRPLPNAEDRTLRELLSQVDVTLLQDGLEDLDVDVDLDLDLDEPVPVFAHVDSEAPAVAADGVRRLATEGGPLAGPGDLNIPVGQMECASQPLTDGSVGASISMSPQPWCNLTSDMTASPDVAGSPFYGSEECLAQYVTEVTGVFGRALKFAFYIPPSTLNPSPWVGQTACEELRVDVTAFGAHLTLWPPQMVWETLGTSHLHGVWVEGLFSQCLMQPSGTGPTPSLPDGHTYFKVRTAARAYRALRGGFLIRGIEAGIIHGNGPC